MQCTGGIVYVSGTDTFYQVKPTTDQISSADIVYLEFAIPVLNKLNELLHQNIVFQSILHGITRGYRSDTPYHAAVLCGTAVVLAYARGVLTHTDVPYPEEGGLEKLKNGLEERKQTYILHVATHLSDLLTPKNLWEKRLSDIGIAFPARKKEANDLAQEINDLLSRWG